MVQRVDLHDPMPPGHSCLADEHRHEPGHGIRVVDMLRKTSAPRPGEVSPGDVRRRVRGSTLHPLSAVDTDGRSPRARSASPRSLKARRR